eukprot:Hpha_TRINITY_DN16377_c2_g2::TRINITY_DN16377_c2_g2_i1::g.58110::m.58110
MAAVKTSTLSCDADAVYLLNHRVPLVIETIIGHLLKEKPPCHQLFPSIERSLHKIEGTMDQKLESEFFRLVDEVARMNRGGQTISAEHFAGLNLTFAVPSTRTPIDLIPGGSSIKVTLDRKDEFVTLALKAKEDLQQRREGKRGEPAATGRGPTPPAQPAADSPPPRRVASSGKMRPQALATGVGPKTDEETTGALFSPTHFAHDLFAPHATTADVKLTQLESRKKVGGETVPSAVAPSADGPLSPGTIRKDFWPMLDAMERFNMPEGDRVTEREWDGMEVTWCVPLSDGTLVDLRQNGRDEPVAFHDKDKYVAAAKEALLQAGHTPPSGKSKPALSVNIKAHKQDEDREHALFSPTHFAHDLFAPHTTSSQVEKQATVESGRGHRPSLPTAIAPDHADNVPYNPVTKHVNPSEGPLSPRTLQEFGTMVWELGEVNKGGATLTKQEWEEMEIAWVVPVDGQMHELIPGGRDKMVKLEEKDRFCELAMEHLRKSGVPTPKAGGGRNRRLSQLAPVVAPKQDEEREHALFSPTHFSHDLFAPHTTSAAVEEKIVQAGVCATVAPDALANGERGALYRPKVVPAEEDESPLSPGTISTDFLPMVDKLQQFNSGPGAPIMTEKEWNEIGITWCVPADTGELHDLCPNGRDIPVGFHEKDRYCTLARSKLLELKKGSKKDRKKPQPLQAGGKQQRNEEKEHAMFSPTHFAHDLFAPHTTTARVGAEATPTASAKLRHRPSLPNVMTGGQDVQYSPEVNAQPSSVPLSPLSPATLNRDFDLMLDHLGDLSEKGITFTEQEWSEMDLTWCVAVGGQLHDLMPNGRNIRVPLQDKDKYCVMARAKIAEQKGSEKKEKKGPGRRLSLQVAQVESQREQREHALFSPTHFAQDLFAPHTTTAEVEAKTTASGVGQRRPSLPVAMPNGGAEYNPHQQNIRDEPSPRNTGGVTDFLPILGQLEKFNKPGEAQISTQEWEEMDVTWCVPWGAELFDLVPNGRDIKVLLTDKHKYCYLARSKIEELRLCDKTDPAEAVKAYGAEYPRCTTEDLRLDLACAQKEEQTAALFSPTHFSQDLFAPHTTTTKVAAVAAQEASTTSQRRPSVPVALAQRNSIQSDPDAVLTPKSAGRKFWPMIDAIAAFNTPEGDSVTAQEFDSMEIFFQVPHPLYPDELVDLIPGGTYVKVTLARKDEFVAAARKFFHDAMAQQEQPAGRSPVIAPLSPKSLNVGFAPMLDEIERMNTAQGDHYTEAEFAELDITWCIPIENEIMDIKPNGRNVKVSLKNKDEYVKLARMRLDFEMKKIARQPPPMPALPDAPAPKAEPQSGLGARTKSNLTLETGAKAKTAQDEEKEHAMFSPTHFAHDLFAPHTTKTQLDKQPGGTTAALRRPSVPTALQTDCVKGRLTPRALEQEFYPMIEELATVNTQSGMRFSEADWEDLGMTFCIPLSAGIVDLIPNGRNIPVRLAERETFVRLVREYKVNSGGGEQHPMLNNKSASRIRLTPLATGKQTMSDEIDRTNAMFSPTHFSHDLFAPAAPPAPAVPIAQPQSTSPQRSSLPEVNQRWSSQNGSPPNRAHTRSSAPQVGQHPAPHPPAQYQAPPPMRPSSMWNDSDLEVDTGAALGRLLTMGQAEFEAAKVTWTYPHQGVVHEIFVGGRTMIVAFDQRFKFADLITQAKRILDTGGVWIPVNSGHPPHHPSRQLQSHSSTSHYMPRQATSASASEAASQAPSLPPLVTPAGAASGAHHHGDGDELFTFLEQSKLSFLLDQIRSEGVETMADLCELLDEDFAFIPKVLHRRRLITALGPYRQANRKKQGH